MLCTSTYDLSNIFSAFLQSNNRSSIFFSIFADRVHFFSPQTCYLTFLHTKMLRQYCALSRKMKERKNVFLFSDQIIMLCHQILNINVFRFCQNIRAFFSYSVFQGFSKAKSANGGSILSSSQFLILPQLPQKIKLASKVVKVESKIIISLHKI